MTAANPRAYGMRVAPAMAVNNDAASAKPAQLANHLCGLAANPSRLGFFVQNQSASVIQVVFTNPDNSGTTILLLEPSASGAGHGGGFIDMGSCPHVGAIDVYAATVGLQVGCADWS